eukprot:3250929-Pyramimonas_sp.AAC.1
MSSVMLSPKPYQSPLTVVPKGCLPSGWPKLLKTCHTKQVILVKRSAWARRAPLHRPARGLCGTKRAGCTIRTKSARVAISRSRAYF